MTEEYKKYLESDEWKYLSLARKSIDNFTCCMCGSKDNLEVHHLTYNKHHEMTRLCDIVTVCRDCHQAIHDFMRSTKNTENKVNNVTSEIASKNDSVVLSLFDSVNPPQRITRTKTWKDEWLDVNIEIVYPSNCGPQYRVRICKDAFEKMGSPEVISLSSNPSYNGDTKFVYFNSGYGLRTIEYNKWFEIRPVMHRTGFPNGEMVGNYKMNFSASGTPYIILSKGGESK